MKICLRGQCKKIDFTPANGKPPRCVIRVELEQYVSDRYRMDEVQIFVPVEFASLLEAGLPVTITLEQN